MMIYFNIDEHNFEHEARFKEYNAYLAGDLKTGKVDWLTQGSEYPSDRFKAEVIRAAKAAGAENGCVIEVNYGIRDYGLTEHFDLIVD